MVPAEPILKQYSEKVYSVLLSLFESTFKELQQMCKIKDTDLCFSLMYLIKENKIAQKRKDNNIYYHIMLSNSEPL